MDRGQYRAMRIDNGEEVKGWLLEHAGRSYIICNIPNVPGVGSINFLGQGCIIEVHPDTVGQRSGMLVENEVSIDWWEGDLLCKGSVHPNAAIAIITYNRREARWVAGSNSGGTDFCSLEEAYKCGWRKIGTIHDKDAT